MIILLILPVLCKVLFRAIFQKVSWLTALIRQHASQLTFSQVNPLTYVALQKRPILHLDFVICITTILRVVGLLIVV